MSCERIIITEEYLMITHDFTNATIGYRMYDGADKKISIEYEGKHYLLKFANHAKKKNELNTSYTSNVFSEYLGCHIFQSCGIETQNTLLGKYNNRFVVACEDFNNSDFHLQEFSKFENSYLGTGNAERTPKLEDMEKIFNNHILLNGIRLEAVERYWDMFIVDALLGNFDRHAGNWGYMINEKNKEVRLAPVYDCGSCLYPQLSDAAISLIINDQKEIDKRVYVFPKAALSLNGQKVNYKEMIEMGYHDCNSALLRIFPKINPDRIRDIIENTPYMSDVRKEFLIKMTSERYQKILEPQYKKISRVSVLNKLHQNQEKVERDLKQHEKEISEQIRYI